MKLYGTLSRDRTYHRATVVEVVLVLVSVGTEVHASGDPGEWTAFLQAQPTVRSFGLRQALKDTGENFVSDTKTCSKSYRRNLTLSWSE